MPHFIIDCSENILNLKSPKQIMQAVYDTAFATGLFAKGDIKVRINAFTHFDIGEDKEAFIHVFGNIMEGRDAQQKSNLSRKVVSTLNKLFPQVSIVSMNIRDFERASYCNKSMV